MLCADEDAVRFANTSDLEEYLGDFAAPTPLRLLESFESSGSLVARAVDRIESGAAFEESLFLGLRLNEGIDLDSLRGQFGEAMLQDAMPALQEVRDAGLLELNPSRIRLTSRGRVLSNEVFSRLLLPSVA